jgi:hypothetical protein
MTASPRPRSVCLAMAALALLLAITAALPVTSCTGVSTNTGSGFPTTLPNFVEDALAISEPQPAGENQLFITSNRDNTKIIRFYSKTGSQLFSTTLTCTGVAFKSVILKDPLKLFVASWDASSYVASISVSVNAGVYSQALAAELNNEEEVGVMLSIPFTAYVWLLAKSDQEVFRVDHLLGVPLDRNMPLFITGKDCSTAHYMGLTLADAQVFIGGPRYFGLYNKADFTQVKQFEFTMSSLNSVYRVVADNLGSAKVFGAAGTADGATKVCFLYDMAVSTPPLVSSAGCPGVNTNNILNFGPYQYVVTIQSGSTNALTFFSKSDPASQASMPLPASQTVASGGISFQGFIVQDHKYYFGLIVGGSTIQNFQSYYLTVDRCAVRDGSNVCTDCVDGLGLYRVGTAPNNLCMTTAEFPAGYGIDTSQSELANLCSTSNCADCVTNYQICIACTAGWYLKSGACYHPTLIPLIPDFFGANTATGSAVACQDTHCKLCKADYTLCTGCDTATGWYRDGTVCKHATLSPTIPDFFGANTGTGLVVACQDTHCKLCKATYLTCTGCDTGNSWFLDVNTCRHATVSPVFTSGTGPNTATGLVVACQEANCKTCMSTYLTCTVCNTGWFIKSGLCYHPTLAPIIPDFFGANIVTGTAIACQDTHCKLCKADYQTCTGCDTSSSWYLDGTTCRHATLSPVFTSGTGPNTATGLVVACQEANCKTCMGTYLTCTVCNTGWFIKSGLCYHPTLAPIIPDFFGANIVTGTAIACQDTHCKLCKADYQTCTGCDTSSSWYLDGTTCKHATVSPIIPDFFGANTGTGLVVACQDTHCKLCKATYLTCTGCDTGNSWFLDVNTCRHATVSPVFTSGTGPNTATGLVVACQEANCKTCMSTYLTCTVCNTGWFIKSGLCYHPTLAPIIPDFFGANIVTGTAIACQDTHCKLCKADYQTCTGCDTSSSWYLDGTTCKHATVSPIIPDFFGANTGTGLVVACQDTHCKLCKATYLTCTGCDTASGWYLDGTTCKHATLTPLIASGFGPNLATGIIVACQLGSCSNCLNNYLNCDSCSPGWYSYSSSCYHPTLAPIIPDFFGANIVTGNAVACQEAHCKLCKADYQICTGCDTTSSWYLDGTTCKHATLSPTIPDFSEPTL